MVKNINEDLKKFIIVNTAEKMHVLDAKGISSRSFLFRCSVIFENYDK